MRLLMLWPAVALFGLCVWWLFHPPVWLRGGPIVTCALCAEVTGTAAEMVEHLRLLHPDKYEELETWPDGGAVIYERLEPEDFR